MLLLFHGLLVHTCVTFATRELFDNLVNKNAYLIANLFLVELVSHLQILNCAFHALSVCDKLFLPFLAPNCRNHGMVEIREHFHEHLPMAGCYISKLKLWGLCRKVYEMFPSCEYSN